MPMPTLNSNTCTRRLARRQNERRSNPFAFNSEEWIVMVQQQYLMWPKQDRRRDDRRAAERREYTFQPSSQRKQARPFQAERFMSSEHLLSNEEKQMILNLYTEETQLGQQPN